MVKSGLKPSSSSFFGPQEHVAGEHVVPRRLGHDPHADAVRRIGAGPAIAREQVAALGVADHAVVEGAVALRRDRLVGLAPVDGAAGDRVLDEELVVGRAAGVDAGADHEGAALAELALAAPDRLLIEIWDAEISMDVAGVLEPERAETEFGNDEARLCHGVSPVALPIERPFTASPRRRADKYAGKLRQFRAQPRAAILISHVRTNAAPRHQIVRAFATKEIKALRAWSAATKGVSKANRATCPACRRSMPSASMPVIVQSEPDKPSSFPA